ncbi:hypothetical protein FRZ06_03865 [Anoxybacterium hadale]|uniref:Uncharacterized protein n=1 Tax=Anoxybacterium hadale TaxID=3408580 RepID=A0ACD1A7Z5_9FIRM|nr:hypothetical protein FRZ06_03865 [Clostridiales bacterium]
MFMNKENSPICKIKSDQKQIKIPVDGQLSKKGTIVKKTSTAGEIDYSIANLVDGINKAGFKSVYSCSGLKKDHPNCEIKPGGGYISFLIQDNDLDAITWIKNAAHRFSLSVEHTYINNKPALVVRIDKDKEGNSLTDRIRIANESGDHASGDFKNRPYGAFTKDLEDIIQRCGGLIYDTDEKIEAAWRKFCSMLLPGISIKNAG